MLLFSKHNNTKFLNAVRVTAPFFSNFIDLPMSGDINAHQKKANSGIIIQSANYLNNYFFSWLVGWLVKKKTFQENKFSVVEISILSLSLLQIGRDIQIQTK